MSLLPIVELCRWGVNGGIKMKMIRKEDEIITFPLSEDAPLQQFIPSDKIYILSKEFGSEETTTIQFKELTVIQERLAYVFTVLKENIENEQRRERRDPVKIDAIVVDMNCLNRGKILDKSDHGLKLKTKGPLLDSVIDVSFVYNGRRRTEVGRIMWRNESDDEYLYGIEMKFNQEVV